MAKDRKQAKAAERKQKLKAKQLHQKEVVRVQNRIEQLLDLDPMGAVERLEAMRQSRPDDRNVLLGYMDACLDANQIRELRHAARDWVARHPDDCEIWRQYAGTCFQESYFHAGQRAAQLVVQRWPGTEEARVCGVFLSVFRETYASVTRWMGPDPSDEMMACHEAIREVTEGGQFEEGVRLATPAASRWPKCQPIRNNLAISLVFLGRYDDAIVECRSTLEAVPGNVFAGAALTRSLYLLGRDDEARQALDDLLTTPSERGERWTKVAEALALMGEEVRLLEWARPVIEQNLDKQTDPLYRAVLRHYAACAEYRQGDERAARKLWREAIQIYRIPVAVENLADLDCPVDNRHAAWYFSRNELFPRPLIEDLLNRLDGQTNEQTTLISRKFLRQHPTIRRLMRVLLEQGDPGGREFACRFCKMVADDESLDLLLDFAEGRWGSLSLRMRAIDTLRSHGRFPEILLKTWMNGKPSELMSISFQITREPQREPTDPVLRKVLVRAHEALQQDNFVQAEKLFEQAVRMDPEDPGHHFNLTSVREMGRLGHDYKRAVQVIHERWPDYGFARMAVAIELAQRGQWQEARDLTCMVMEKSELHFTEFRMLAMCQVAIGIASGEFPSAKSWLDMAKSVLPDETDLHEMLQQQITMAETPDLLSRAMKLFDRFR